MSNELRERLGKLSTEVSKIERELGGDYLLTDESEGNIKYHLRDVQEAISLAISCIEVSDKIIVHVTYRPYGSQSAFVLTDTFVADESTKNMDLADWIRKTSKEYPGLRIIKLEEHPYEGGN